MKNYIKLLTATLIVALTFALIAPAVFASDALVINSEAVECERGKTVEVALVVESNPGFAALMINVSKVPGIEVTNVENGTVMSQMTSGNNILWDAASNSTETGTLVVLTFSISDTAELGEHQITVNAFECFNDSLKSVNVSIAPIVINVIEEKETVEETDSETEAESKDSVESVETEGDKVDTEIADTASQDDTTAGGCNSVISGSALIVSLLSVAIFSFRRKED